MQKIQIILQAGEGGDDSKMFVQDMARMYIRYAESLGAD